LLLMERAFCSVQRGLCLPRVPYQGDVAPLLMQAFDDTDLKTL
jgi:hypothetical protein